MPVSKKRKKKRLGSGGRPRLPRTSSIPSTAAADEHLFRDLQLGLSDFPDLRCILPPDYPRGRRSGVSVSAMQSYSDDRTSWHRLNLPLALHVYQNAVNSDVRTLMRSLLGTLDEFVRVFRHLPHCQSLLAPLWKDAFAPTSHFWTEVSYAFLAIRWQRADIEVLGFEQPIGTRGKDADLTVRLAGKRTHVEVETHHRADFCGKTDLEVRNELKKRAAEKAALKFPALPADEVGVIAELCVVSKDDATRDFGDPRVEQLDTEHENWRWMSCRLVGGRDDADLVHFVITSL